MSYLNLVIADADGDKSTVAIDFAGAFAGDLTGLAETAWALINPLVSGKLVGASVTLEADISGFVNAAANVLSDVQEKAEFIFESIGGFTKSITLPTFVETLFTGAGAGKTVDLTNTDVAAFVTAMEDGISDGGTDEINPTTYHGEDISGLRAARQSWGKNRR